MARISDGDLHGAIAMVGDVQQASTRKSTNAPYFGDVLDHASTLTSGQVTNDFRHAARTGSARSRADTTICYHGDGSIFKNLKRLLGPIERARIAHRGAHRPENRAGTQQRRQGPQSVKRL